MGTYRMYTGPDGKTHWQEIDLALTPEWTKGIEVNDIRFQSRPPGNEAGWHTAPRRQFVIILSGQMEIGFEGGETKVFGPGDARLVEDTTGTGHTTTRLGDEPVVTATITLRDQGGT